MSSGLKNDSLFAKSPKSHAKSILRSVQKTDRNLYPVFFEGVNVTPKPLNPLSFKEGRERQISILHIKDSSEGNADFSSSCFVSQIYHSSRYSTDMNQILSYGTADTYLSYALDSARDTMSSYFEIKAPVEKLRPMPSKISLLLVETPTFFIFDLASKTADKESEEGMIISVTLHLPQCSECKLKPNYPCD